MTPINCVELGCRLRINQFFGTVRYIGQVANYDGTWVGVEWDDSARGKHNGTVNGVEYFKTSSPTSGTMIRIEKLPKFESLAEAIRDKYINEATFKLDDDMIKDVQKQFRASLFEVVGMEKIGMKQSNLSDLVDVAVAFSMTICPGNLETFKNLKTLDISSTLIWNWKIVADIASQIPTLLEVNLADNRLETPTEEALLELEPNFRNLRKLNLRNCNLHSWSHFLYLAKMWPFVEYISLEHNSLSVITDENCDQVLTNLKTLDLQNNSISDSASINCLGKIDSLETLFLMNNAIEKLEFPDCDHTQKVDLFKNLVSIFLRDNPLVDDCWAYNELDKLPSLENLSSNPNPDFGYEETLSRAVGLISGLKTFNRSEVLVNLRRDSECDIWKKYAVEYTSVKDDAERVQQFLNHHRVYAKIMERFGDPEQCLPDKKKKSNMINLQLLNTSTAETKVKKVPKRINLQTLQNLIIKLFAFDNVSALRMFVLDRKRNVQIPLDNFNKSLDFYSIEDDDTIVFET